MSSKSSATSPPQFTRLRIIKNVAVMCGVFFITFLAYDCQLMLQSTLNHEGGIGVVTQAVAFGCFCVSALLLPKYVIQRLGCKFTMMLSILLYVPYIASNMYPHWALMVPAAVLNGSAASLLWGAQCQYLNEMAMMYHEGSKSRQRPESGVQDCCCDEGENQCCKGKVGHPGLKSPNPHDEAISEKAEPNVPPSKTSQAPGGRVGLSSKAVQSTTARFFGIHGMAYLSTHMWGNLMSYLILQSDDAPSGRFLNSSSCVCGAHFCNERSDCLLHNLQEPGPEKRTLLIGLCTGLGLLSVVLMALLLDPLDDRKKEVRFSVDFLLATFRHLRKRNQIFLTPLSYYTGMMQAFYIGDFNMSFVGCAWGTYHVGLVSMCYGAACATSSPLSGYAVKYIGRIPIILFSALLNVATQILLLVWSPSSEQPALFFVAAVFWGISLGIFFPQVKAMYGFLFKDDEEVAFAAFHLWYALGFCVSFAYSSHLCTHLKIYAVMAVLIVGIAGYLCVEMFLRKKIKQLAK